MSKTKTVEVMAMMLNQTENVKAADLFLNVGDLSYADGCQVGLQVHRVGIGGISLEGKARLILLMSPLAALG